MVLQICNKFNKYRSKLLKIITNQNISIISDHVLDLINERIFIMKKILLAISALSAALFSTAANADISVSGSANAVYVDAGGNSQGHVGGTISFALSTVTDGGVTISTAGQITNDPDAPGGAGTASGMTALTFGFANGSLTFADDVAVPAGTGLVGELVDTPFDISS